jgi:hypothetical protein
VVSEAAQSQFALLNKFTYAVQLVCSKDLVLPVACDVAIHAYVCVCSQWVPQIV